MGMMRALEDRRSTGLDDRPRHAVYREPLPYPAYLSEHGQRLQPRDAYRKEVPWGKIISGGLAGLFLLLTFASWAVQEVLAYVERQSLRSYELSMEAIELGKSAVTSNGAVAVSKSSQTAGADPGVIVLMIFLGLGALCILKGLARFGK